MLRTTFPSRAITYAVIAIIWSTCASAGEQSVIDKTQIHSDLDSDSVFGVVALEFDTSRVREFREAKLPLPPGGGILVQHVISGGPAQEVGFAIGDVISVKNDRRIIRDPDEFAQWVKSKEAGSPVEVTRLRLIYDLKGRWRWDRKKVVLSPTTRKELKDIRLRHSYLNIDEEFVELSYFDLGKPSSWGGIHPVNDRKYYRLREGTTMSTSDPKRRPRGAVDITDEVVAKKRAERELLLPKIEVGQFGKIKSCRVIQVLGDNDMIVEIGYDDLGWTRIGVPDEFKAVRVIGLSTQGVVDDRKYNYDSPIAIIDTWDYTTVLGAKRTIYRAVAVDMINVGLSEKDLAQLKSILPDDER